MVDFSFFPLAAPQPAALLQTNETTRQYGLVLTRADAEVLVTEGQSLLTQHDRVEIGDSILPKLIVAFAESGYLPPETYVETLLTLLDLFYHVKNETFGLASDDEIVAEMARAFVSPCHGVVDCLIDHMEETFCRSYAARFYGITPEPPDEEDENDDCDSDDC